MSYCRRHLPHWQPRGKALFITWRLHPSCEEQHWLARPEIAKIVIDSLHFGSLHFGAVKLERYYLHCYVVMSNHIHVLLDPHAETIMILKSLKGITARRANALLKRTGSPFWQDESFDHWIRNEQEFCSHGSIHRRKSGSGWPRTAVRRLSLVQCV